MLRSLSVFTKTFFTFVHMNTTLYNMDSKAALVIVRKHYAVDPVCILE